MDRSKILSRRIHDEDGLSALRWALDIAYIKAIVKGFEEQLEDPVLDIVYQNHLHNVEARRNSLLKSSQIRCIIREHEIQMDYAKI